jgi:hypothetical protein
MAVLGSNLFKFVFSASGNTDLLFPLRKTWSNCVDVLCRRRRRRRRRRREALLTGGRLRLRNDALKTLVVCSGHDDRLVSIWEEVAKGAGEGIFGGCGMRMRLRRRRRRCGQRMRRGPVSGGRLQQGGRRRAQLSWLWDWSFL